MRDNNLNKTQFKVVPTYNSIFLHALIVQIDTTDLALAVPPKVGYLSTIHERGSEMRRDEHDEI